MNLLDDLVSRRKRAHEQMKAHVDAAEKRGEWTAEDEQTYKRMNEDIDLLDDRIAEVQESRIATPGRFGERNGNQHRSRIEQQFRALASGQIRSLDIPFSESRDLLKSTSDTPKAGYTVPQSFVGQLYVHMIETAGIRRTNATVLRTDSGEDLVVPKTTADGTAALIAEAASITESDPTFGAVTLGSYKYATFHQVSRELLEDTGVDILAYLAKQAGRAMGNKSGEHFITGDGSGKPNGVVTASTLGKSFAGAAAITADELIDLYFSVSEPYRANAHWMMKDSTMHLIRKLKDGQSNYLFDFSGDGRIPTLLGKPVVTDPYMPAATTGNKSVLFGDFSAYYIRDAKGIRWERSDDFAFQNDLVSFKAVLRTDGDLVDTTGAVKHGIQA